MRHAVRLVLSLAVLLPLTARAQYAAPRYTSQAPASRLELVGLAGYHISSDIDFHAGTATIDDGASYGAAARFRLSPGETVDLLWIIVPTNINVRSTYGSGRTSLTINYFQIGGTTSIRQDRVEPYFGGTLGAVVFSPGSLTTTNGTRFTGSDTWRFGMTLGGGLKFWLSEKVALQADARMLLPVWFSSSSFYVGTGGAALGVSGGIPTVEGNFTGGLVIAL